MSDQLRAQIKVATDAGQPLNLVVSPRTLAISQPLVRGIENTGGGIYRYNPKTGLLTEY
ncbi:putative toxin [Pseudomonas sp. Fl4BN1]|uniref:putative toxin n=1 Tax=Pseudomonas sp. Fl4BN1 TaxID=2697651 RepID=UPI001376BC03|nr:hypothetical protein [Pseudomonas sp. Fl4BN1]